MVDHLAAAGLPPADNRLEPGVDFRDVVERQAIDGYGQPAVVSACAEGELVGERPGELLKLPHLNVGRLLPAREDDVAISTHSWAFLPRRKINKCASWGANFFTCGRD